MSKKIIYILIALFLIGIILILIELNSNSESDSTLENEEKFEIKSSHEESLPNEITINNDNGKSFTISKSSLPDLEKYLNEEMDIKTELERLQYEYLNWHFSNNQYFILKFGCGNKSCHLLLIQINEMNEVKTTSLGEGIYTGSKEFEKKAMLHIAANEGNEVVRHQMIIVDLNSMDIFLPADINKRDLYFSSPLYPIPDFSWITAHSIELVVADIPDTTFESIEKWYNASNPPVKSVETIIE